MKKILLHCCCAPCAIYPVKVLLEENFEIILFWDNFNIHPLMEYIRRLETLIQYAKDENIPLVKNVNYELEYFIDLIGRDREFKKRCIPCYKVRIERTIQKAKEMGIEYFSSTLFVSPYQDQEVMRKLSRELAEKNNIKFFDKDFREGFRWAHQVARERGYYTQPYCGCIYSESERYQKKLKKYQKDA